MKVSEQPVGIDLVREAVHKLDASEKRIADQEAVVAQKRANLASEEAVLAKLRAEHAQAEQRLADLISTGSCAHHHDHVDPSNIVNPIVALEDKSVPIKWRIACMLLVDPILDYQETAARLWGSSDKRTNKNRVNAHIQQLRRLGVLRTLGSNKFEVDRAKLAELSGLPVDGAQTG
jgi:hypothetical protein